MCVCFWTARRVYPGVSSRGWVLVRGNYIWESLVFVSRLRVFTLRAEIEKRVLDFGRS